MKHPLSYDDLLSENAALKEKNKILEEKLCLLENSNALPENRLKQIDQHDQNISLLSKREKEILYWICNGLNTKQIAEKLFISPFTVQTHRRSIRSILNIPRSVSIIAYVIKNNLIIIPENK